MKTRADTWESELDEAQRMYAFELVRDLGGPKALGLIESELGVSPSMSSLYRFFDRMKPVVDEDRLRRAVAAKASIESTCDELGDIDGTLARALAFSGLEAVASGDPDRIKVMIAMYNDVLRRKVVEGDLQLKRDKFEDVIRRNAEAREKLEGVKAAEGVSAESVARIEEVLNLL